MAKAGDREAERARAKAQLERLKDAKELKQFSHNCKRHGFEDIAAKASHKAEIRTRLDQANIWEERAERQLPPAKNELEKKIRECWIKSCGLLGRVGMRSRQMAERHGYVEATLRMVTKERIGGGNFEKLVELGGIRYTSEYQLCKYLRDKADPRILKLVEKLLRQYGLEAGRDY